jgi:hypothetical protein
MAPAVPVSYARLSVSGRRRPPDLSIRSEIDIDPRYAARTCFVVRRFGT